MKQNIHPKWYEEAEVVCACGNIFTIGATQPKIRVEICSKCHPFYTGEMKYVDTLGRVEKFQKKQQIAKEAEPILIAKKKKKQDQEKEDKRPRTLREMLLGTS